MVLSKRLVRKDVADDDEVSVVAGRLEPTPSTVIGIINSRGDLRMGSLTDSRIGSRIPFLLSGLLVSAEASICVDSCRFPLLKKFNNK